MTQATADGRSELAGLLERLRKAVGPDRNLDLELATALVPDVIVLRRNDADTANELYTYWEYTASIDAALALVGRLLPGAPVVIYTCDGTLAQASIGASYPDRYEASTPALAILIALLTALTQEPTP